MHTLLVFLLAAQTAQTPQTPTPQTPPKPPTGTTGTQARRPAATTGGVEIRVTDRSGDPAAGAQVTAEGPSRRDGTADANGVVTFRTMLPGTYRVRAQGDGLVTLEKEIAIRAGAPAATDFALAAAPAVASTSTPPAPVTPPPAPAPPAASAVGARGEPRVLSITDLAERSLSGRDPTKTVPVGCTGLSRAQLVVVRESLPGTSRADADEMLYLVAGEATLKLADKDQTITPGAFGIVPRGTSYAITRRGRNPAILLSITAGPPCPAP